MAEPSGWGRRNGVTGAIESAPRFRCGYIKVMTLPKETSDDRCTDKPTNERMRIAGALPKEKVASWKRRSPGRLGTGSPA